ncbi:MAG: DUF1957 domain-containing protein [Ignavibacteriae bacterium]|nr:DUF1957 domain-containing protein [Ignavibacteriota bacterium]
MHSGNYLLALHTHLPWVLHHGQSPHGVDWLCEAVAECYIPLLNKFHELLDENILPKVTIDISPILCEQLEHKDFKPIFEKYCSEKIEAAQIDEKNFTDLGFNSHQIWLAKYWQKWYDDRKSNFIYNYNSSIIGAFKKLQDDGAVEIVTCGATHGYLPLLGFDKSISLQIKLAVENYQKHFGRKPRGIWLPECAYRPTYDWKSLIPVNPFHQSRLRPGIEQFLSRNGIDYFFTDQNLTDRAKPLGIFIDADKEKFIDLKSMPASLSNINYKDMHLIPFHVSSSENTAFGNSIVYTRHRDISMQVWSGEVGYPGQSDYLDFHKKHLPSMIRYWRVTDNKADMMYKTLYEPSWTQDKIDLQSNHFIHHVENTLNYFNNQSGKFGTLCTPFDTELFGHWWFEGPEFIKSVIKGLHHSPYVKTATASEQIYRIKPCEVMSLPEGSWGENNNHDVWCNDENKWTWEAEYNDELRLHELMKKIPIENLNENQTRIYKQALKELLLLQSSDWQFLIHTKSARDYAEQRFSYHHSDFNRLCELIEKSNDNNLTREDLNYLEITENRNSVFPELKLEWWDDFWEKFT